MEGVVFTHSSAALSLTGRVGAGQIRHLDTSMLLVQHKQARGEVKYDNVLGSNNMADKWTNHVEHIVRHHHMIQFGFRYDVGRSLKAVQLNV